MKTQVLGDKRIIQINKKQSEYHSFTAVFTVKKLHCSLNSCLHSTLISFNCTKKRRIDHPPFDTYDFKFISATTAHCAPCLIPPLNHPSVVVCEVLPSSLLWMFSHFHSCDFSAIHRFHP